MTTEVESTIDLTQMEVAVIWANRAQDRPGRKEILKRIVEEASICIRKAPSILELGSGPGFLAEKILQRIPNAQYTALDFSPAMHQLARVRLEHVASRIEFLERSFKSEGWVDGLGPFDVIVTNQAVHELRHKSLAETLHRQVYRLLKLSGVYLVSDHFSDEGGLKNTELFMTKDEQQQALSSADFEFVDRLFKKESLVLHLARKEKH